MTRLTAIAAICGVLLAGCATDGVKLVEGTDLSLGLSLPGTEGDLTFYMLNWLSGFKMETSEPCKLKCKYSVAETNDYFGCVTTRTAKSIDAEVEPVPEEPVATATSPSEEGAANGHD